VVELDRRQRCPGRIWEAATTALAQTPPTASRDRSAPALVGAAGGECELWRCANERSQAQSVAVDIERLLARHAGEASSARPRVAVLVPEITHEGQAVSVALEERA